MAGIETFTAQNQSDGVATSYTAVTGTIGKRYGIELFVLSSTADVTLDIMSGNRVVLDNVAIKAGETVSLTTELEDAGWGAGAPINFVANSGTPVVSWNIRYFAIDAPQSTVYLDPTNGLDGYVGTSPDCPKQTMGACVTLVNNTSLGFTKIAVLSGETVSTTAKINITATSLTVEAYGGSTNPIFECNNTDPVFELDGSGAFYRFFGVTIQQASSGTGADSYGIAFASGASGILDVDNCTIQNCQVGIHLPAPTFGTLRVTDSIINNCQNEGICVSAPVANTAAWTLEIERTTIGNSGQGVTTAEQGAGIRAEGWLRGYIDTCTFTDNRLGIVAGPVAGSDLAVLRCYFSATWDSANYTDAAKPSHLYARQGSGYDAPTSITAALCKFFCTSNESGDLAVVTNAAHIELINCTLAVAGTTATDAIEALGGTIALWNSIVHLNGTTGHRYFRTISATAPYTVSGDFNIFFGGTNGFIVNGSTPQSFAATQTAGEQSASYEEDPGLVDPTATGADSLDLAAVTGNVAESGQHVAAFIALETLRAYTDQNGSTISRLGIGADVG